MSARELVLELVLDAPRANIWRCWTEPNLLKQWFCPRPWTVSSAEMEVRAGGASEIVMRGPNGEEMPNRGVYLEVVPGRRLVFTDAYVDAWTPSEKPFMTGIIELTDVEGAKTGYLARVLHWSAGDRDQHEKMGFHDGWRMAARQLEELARTLG